MSGCRYISGIGQARWLGVGALDWPTTAPPIDEEHAGPA